MLHQNIENLVLEGGAEKAFAHVGALIKLEEIGILQKVRRVAGTSAGSLFAGLLAANFTAQDILKVSSTLNFSELAHNSIFCGAYCIFRYEGYGIHSSDSIRQQIVDILATRDIPEDITLKQLFDLTKKDLVIVTSNINRERGVYLHHAQYPDVKLVDAMLCSIGIPVLLRAHIKDYLKGSNDYYLDGGIVDNYPIWVFNDLDALYTGTLYSVERDRIPSTTLGLKLLTPGETNSYDVVTQRKDINSFESFLIQILNTMMTQIDRSLVSESYIKQTIPIHVDSISFLKFDMTREQIEKLIEQGKCSVEKYFSVSQAK
jgi:predicted acylesterase/phospholipase RssA